MVRFGEAIQASPKCTWQEVGFDRAEGNCEVMTEGTHMTCCQYDALLSRR
jgi:hypothetical protein